MRNVFSSKILVFGEYAIIAGGEALAIPYPQFTAEWIESAESPSEFKPYLLQFADYLNKQDAITPFLDTDTFCKQLDAGLDIRSNIPIGYGAGSSGALVAAVYDRFAKPSTDKQDLAVLKNILGRMEDFFHKKSSGFDPLVSYINKPLLIQSDGNIEIIENEMPLLQNMRLFDSGFHRFTHHLVDIFQERMKDLEYQHEIIPMLLNLNASCIRYLLANDTTHFYTALRKLSAFQLEYLNFAIPPAVRETWMYELDHGSSIMKLCGAGGGGFMLQFQE